MKKVAAKFKGRKHNERRVEPLDTVEEMIKKSEQMGMTMIR